MTIFNQTFTDDKPIYYPSNWQTGKTAEELYLQWKLTPQYFVLSNILQSIIAALWLCLVFVILNAIKQMWRLYNLPDGTRQKLQNRQYIDKSFIMSTCFIAAIAFSVTITLCIMNEFTRYALFKGLIFCMSTYGLKKLYSKAKKIYQDSKQHKKEYQKIKKDDEQLQ